jgi:site-specific recombinase XerD
MQEFCNWLEATGYSEVNIRGHLRRLFEVFTHARSIKADDARASEFLHRLFGRHCTCVWRSQHFRGTERAYIRFLSDRQRLLPAPPLTHPVAILRQQYHQYLVEVRGFAKSTLDSHRFTVSEFLENALPSERNLKGLGDAHVERYLATKSKVLTRQSMQHVVAHLRAFLRFAFARGLIRRRLDSIDTPRTYRDELPPRALPWSLVRKLLSSVDQSSKAGRRDYAILHLMAYYGLRASEIADLRLVDVDFEARTCRVRQRKTSSDLLLPLSIRTLGVLRQYLRRERPPLDHPSLFLRARRPSGGLDHYAACDVFYKRASESGLGLDHYSSYCLRHSFAMRLLQRGVGVKAIGDLLGHRSLEATCVYLRLDMSALRGVALPLRQHPAR